MRDSPLRGVFGLALWCLAGAAWSQDGASLYLGAEGSYRSGDFGTNNTVTLSSLSLIGGAVGETYDASFSVPWLRLDDELSDAESGLGDIVVRVGGALVEETEDGFSLYGSLSAKLATGDEDRGLGSGEADYGGFLTVSQDFDPVRASLLGGYIWLGDPPGLDYDNIYVVEGTLFRRFDRLGAYLSLQGRGASVDGVDDPLEFYAGGFYALSEDFMLTASALVGLSDASPDFGATLGILRWF